MPVFYRLAFHRECLNGAHLKDNASFPAELSWTENQGHLEDNDGEVWLQHCCLGNREEQVLSCDKASTDLYSEELIRLLPSLWPSGKSHLSCLVFGTAGDRPPDMGAQESWYFLKWVCHGPCDHGAFSHCYLHSSSEQVSSETLTSEQQGRGWACW